MVIASLYNGMKCKGKNTKTRLPTSLYRDHIISPFRIRRNTFYTNCNMIVTQKLLDDTAKKKGKLPKCIKCSLTVRK